MSHGILSLKLSEMDGQIARMHSRIQLSEVLSPDRIHGEVQELKRECQEREDFVRKSLECLRAREASVLFGAYERMEEIRRQAFHLLKEKSPDSGKDEDTERKVHHRNVSAEAGIPHGMCRKVASGNELDREGWLYFAKEFGI